MNCSHFGKKARDLCAQVVDPVFFQNGATAIREKEAAAFAKESGDLKTNITAVGKAVAALEKGVKGQSGGFLQTEAASILKNLVVTDQKLVDVDREDLTAFLSGGSNNGYAPQSGAITGILKQMGDTMSATLKDVTATEEEAKKTYDAAEVEALTESIEEKTKRIGELGVEVVGLKQDLSDCICFGHVKMSCDVCVHRSKCQHFCENLTKLKKSLVAQSPC